MKTAHKILASIISGAQLLQLLIVPFLFFASTPVKATTTPAIEFSYSQAENSFNIAAQPVKSINYSVVYNTAQGISDGFQDGGETQAPYFYSASHLAGSQSADDKTLYQPQNGILKLTAINLDDSEYVYESAFSLIDGQLQLEKPTRKLTEWFTNDNGTHSISQVKQHVTYAFPDGSGGSITFTQLPEPAGNLVFRSITLSPEDQAAINAVSPQAFELTSSMANDSFAYDLTLPLPVDPNLNRDQLTIEYSHDGEEFNAISNSEVKNANVVVKNIRHFTIFTITSPPLTASNIIDDGDSAFSTTGSWSRLHYGGVKGDFLYASNITAGQEARWTLSDDQLPNSAVGYKIYLHWTTDPNRKTNVNYQLYNDSDGLETTLATINQQLLADQATAGSPNADSGWYEVPGTFNLENDWYVSVKTDGVLDYKYIIADAIRIVTADAPTTVYVDNDWSSEPLGNDVGSDRVIGYNAFDTIAEGMDAVQSGGEVRILPGTYSGNITISKPLTLRSDNPSDKAQIIGTGGKAITVNSDDVVIDSLHIANPTGTQAVYSKNTNNLSVTNNTITNVKSSSGNVHAVLIESGSNDVSDFLIDNNVFSDIGYFGSLATGMSASAVTVGFSNGTTEISDVTITNNTVSNIRSTGSSYVWPVSKGAYAFLINNGSSTTPAYDGINPNVKIEHNTISDLEGLWSHAIGLEGDTPNTVVRYNTISDLRDHKSPTDSIAIFFEANTYADTVTVEFNKLEDTDAFGVALHPLLTGETVTAKKNWWGDASGPSFSSPGSGSAVGPSINFCPWLTNDNLSSPTYGGDCLGYIQGRTFIDQNSNGRLIKADGDHPAGMTNGFTARLYDSTWNLLQTQVTPTTAEAGQYKFANLLSEGTTYNICLVETALHEQSMPPLGSHPVNFSNKTIPPEYANAITVNNSSGQSDEGETCWQTTLTANNGAYLQLGYVERDLTGPTAPSITFPNESDFFATAPILNQWSAGADHAGIAYYRIQYEYDDGHTFSGYPYRTTTSLSRNHSPGIGEQGGVKFRVQAFDTLGNEGDWSEWVHYYYDATKPSSSFLTPSNNTQTNQQLAISGSSTDNLWVDYVDLSYKLSSDSAWTALARINNTESDEPFAWSHNWTPPADGEYDLRAQATDKAGNQENTAYVTNVTYDGTSPSNPGTPVSSPNPTNNASQTWNWTAAIDNLTGIASYSWRIVGSSVFSGTVSSSVLELATSLTEGTWSFFLKAIDGVGNESTEVEGNLTVDMTPPATPTLNSPVDDYATRGIAFTQKWNAVSDAVLYEYQSCKTDPGDAGSNCADVKYTNTYAGTTKSVGAGQPNSHFWWRVRAQDAAGNWSNWSESRELIIDNDKPATSLDAYPAPLVSGFTNDSTPTLTGISTDSYDAGLGQTEYRVLNASSIVIIDWTPATFTSGSDGDLSRNFSFTTAALADGEYTFEARATDRAGNLESTATQNLIIDTSNPVVTMDNPLEGDYLRGTATISASIVDAHNYRYYFVINKKSGETQVNVGTVYNSDSDIDFSYTWDTTTAADGEYIIHLAARDKANNRLDGVSSKSINVIVDNTLPTSTITGPGEALPGDPNTIIVEDWDGTVEGLADDNLSGVAKVWLSIANDTTGHYWNGSTWVSGSEASTRVLATLNPDNSWSYAIADPETNIAEGQYTVMAHAQDVAGNLENTSTLVIIYDKSIPEVSISLNPASPDGENNWYKTRPTITLIANDGYAIDRIEYQWGSGAWTTYSEAFTIPGEGSYVLSYRALDLASKYSEIGKKTIQWDSSGLTEGPLEVGVNPNPTSGTTATVTWKAGSDNTGIVNYEIIWKTADGATTYSKLVGGDVRSTEIDKLTTEGIWRITVKAKDSVGNSKEASVDLTVDRTAPSAPTLTLTGTGPGSADLSWNTISDASDYIILYGTTSGSYPYAARVGNRASFTVQGLTAGNYFFVVRAVDNVNNQSGNSNEVNTGTITGAPGATGEIATGFAPAGEVLGVNTLSEEDAEQTSDVTTNQGEVLGTTTSACPHTPWWWAIVTAGYILMLAAQLIPQAGLRGMASLLAAGLVIGLAIGLTCSPWLWSGLSLGLAGLILLIRWTFSPANTTITLPKAPPKK